MLSKRVLQDLLDQEGRQEFLAARINSRIAYQIRALRNQRGWKQAEFARKLGKPQSNVSTRLENPDYDGHKIGTLREVANAFDMALLVTFVDYGEFLSRTSDLSQESLEVDSFSPKQLELFEAQLARASEDKYRQL
jgi:transcriptional regulator with XRE-family HTH domain